MQCGQFRPIFKAMEQSSKPTNAESARQDSDLASEVLGAWKSAIDSSGVPRMRKVDAHRNLLGVGALSGSGFAYPGVVSGVPVIEQDGTADQETDRKTSFNKTSDSE